jgi:eukaryotic-like serine/threonine-protein kinase
LIRRLGRYELLEQVGSGGMAAVYRGRDTALDREVAVKLLHPHLASAHESRARFSREARAVARLSHPGIVEIYDFAGETSPESYLVTEFIRGRTLRAYAQEVGFGFPEVGALVGRALVDALVHAHSAGVIHRDLKPENVLVQEGERPALKLADFGIARILTSDERMTMTGALVGSPQHMAPEIVEGREADARSDLFSIGTILYWLATGRLPFQASNPTAILRRVLEGDFEDPRMADARVSDALAGIIVRCLAVDPAARPASAAEVRDALDAALEDTGLERAADELTAFLRDPAAYRAAFPARAVAALTARGDAALGQGASARALAFYSRVLAIDPQNAIVPAKLARLSRRRRTHRALAAAGLAAAATAAVVVGVLALLPRGHGPGLAAPAPPAVAAAGSSAPAGPPAPAASSAAAPEPAGAPSGAARPAPSAAAAPAAAAPQSSPPVATAAAPRSPPATGAAPAPEVRKGAARAAAPARREGGPTRLDVHVRPYAQRALLDGVEIARGEQIVRFSLDPARPHVIQIEHACCAPYVREIRVGEAFPGGELRVPLSPRPARLRVEGDPATRVYVDGRYVGTAGESQRAPFSVPVPSNPATPYEGPARIGLEAAGEPARDVQVKLRAGGEVVVAAPVAEGMP